MRRLYEPRHIPASHRLSAWLLSALFALSLCVQQAWAAPAERTVIPLGQAVGIKLFADGVLVVALADGPTPARTCGIRNSKGEYDFRILGNASYNQNTGTGALGGSAEPGIVLVSKDENGNGLPDDEWYELAGSEYGKDTETRNYEITYYRPQPANGDVRWTDNQGGEGFVYRNSYHQQGSYYPNWIEEDEITFRGTRLKDNAINEGGTWVGYCYPWGYADNHPNRSEFSQFKIDWAVDQNGNHVELDKIDFVKIYTAVNQNVGWMGEISTEVMTVEDLHFEN